MSDKITKSENQWRAQLAPNEFEVTRNKATERPFSGRYWDTVEPGTYKCICCDTELFSSDTKYDAGCGWPSFTAPASDEAIATSDDHSLGTLRTEVLCARCDAHLGHRFPDGPAEAGGTRYCINSCALTLEPSKNSE